MDITLKQLQIFQAVVVAGSITKASRRIGLSQPSISQQLAKLEEKLGAQLIHRNRTGLINVTPAGEFWSKKSDEMLRRLDGVINEHRTRFVENTISLRLGVTPTLRGKFASAAARIAMEEPGFVKFDLQFALTSAELVEQLRLHQINCAVVNVESLAEDRASFVVAKLFDDPIAWVVPISVPMPAIQRAFSRAATSRDLAGPLGRYVEISGNVASRPMSDDWYRDVLPGATPMFSATTYVAAVDIVNEGLATTHCPLSLVPNLSNSVRNNLQLFALDGLDRTMVLVMPKHLLSLPSYARIFRRIEEFCRTDYNREMVSDEMVLLNRVG